jgi:hypothetical protein
LVLDGARSDCVDVIGIEDWLEARLHVWSATTWEGFQLIGFQAAIMQAQPRLDSDHHMDSPSDEKNASD